MYKYLDFSSRISLNFITNSLGGHIKNEYDNEMSNLKDDTLNKLSDYETKTGLENMNDLRNAGMNLKTIRGRNVGFITNGFITKLIRLLRKKKIL